MEVVMPNFSDFISNASKDVQLGKNIISELINLENKPDDKLNESAKTLSNKFDSAGYTVSVEDCKKILINKSAITDAANTVEPLY